MMGRRKEGRLSLLFVHSVLFPFVFYLPITPRAPFGHACDSNRNDWARVRVLPQYSQPYHAFKTSLLHRGEQRPLCVEGMLGRRKKEARKARWEGERAAGVSTEETRERDSIKTLLTLRAFHPVRGTYPHKQANCYHSRKPCKMITGSQSNQYDRRSVDFECSRTSRASYSILCAKTVLLGLRVQRS